MYSPQFGGGFGLQATKDIKKGEVILSVGKEVWGDYEVGAASEYLKNEHTTTYDVIHDTAFHKIAPNNQELAQEFVHVVSLATVLSIKKEQNDVPYMKFIQESSKFNSQPSVLAMKEEWVDCLKGTTCGDNIKTRRDIFYQISKLCFPKREEDFLSMMGIITSRAISGENKPMAIVPYLDLCNHNMQHNAIHEFNVSTKCFELKSVDDIVKGDEVFINYGEDRVNNSFVYLYGFMEKNNKNDVLAIKVPLKYSAQTPEEDEWREKKFVFEDGAIHFQIPMEFFLQIPAAERDNVGHIVAEVEHAEMDPTKFETGMQHILSLYRVILGAARCSVSRTEKEYDSLHFDEEAAVENLLGHIHGRIMELKKHERPEVVDNYGDFSKPSREWQETCRLMRWRESEVLSALLRSIVIYGERRKMLSERDGV